MIISRQYIEPDLDRFTLRDRDNMHSDIDGYRHLAAISSVCQTLQVQGSLEVAGIVGLNKLWDGVAQVWLLTSDVARGHGVSYTKECKRLMDFHSSRLGIHRVHIVVDAGIQENLRWAKVLGFEYESTMRHAAPDGGDMLVMVYWPKGGRYGRRGTIRTAA